MLPQRLLRRIFINASGIASIDEFDGDLSIQLRLSEHMQSRIFWMNYYSADIVALLDQVLHPGMVVIDVGANIGEITMVSAKRVGPKGRVIAFEPLAIVADILDQNIQCNALSWVSVVRMGLAARRGKAKLYNSCGQGEALNEHFGLGSLYGGSPDTTPCQEVRLTTLDAFLEEHPVAQVDLIKIDIEGAELPCLRGADTTLRTHSPVLIIEVQAETALAAGYHQSDILEFLENYGYRFRRIERGGRLGNVSADSLSDYQNILCVPKTMKDLAPEDMR